MKLNKLILSVIQQAQVGRLKTILKRLSPQEIQKCQSEITKRTLLHEATRLKDPQAVSLLLEKYRSGDVNLAVAVNARDKKGATPLYLAAMLGRLPSARLLLKAGAIPDLSNRDGRTPLHAACEKDNAKLVKTLLEIGKANINAVDNRHSTPLHVAAHWGFPEPLRVLLTQENIDVNMRNQLGWAAIHSAARRGHQSIVSLLANELVCANLDLQDNNGCAPLHHAADSGHKKAVEALLKAGASVNLRDSVQGATPLHYASHRGHEEIVSLLLRYGALQSIMSNDGWTALHVACRLRRLNVVRILLAESDAPLQSRARRGWMPMHAAAFTGNAEIVRCLIKAGASVAPPLTDSWTPLHLAAMCGRTEAVGVLLSAGADPVQVERRHGLTSLDVSLIFQHTGCAMLLIKHCLNNKTNYSKSLYNRFLEAFEGPDDFGEPEKLVTRLEQRVNNEESMKSASRQKIEGQHLYDALVNAGFTQSRARLQAAIADHLQALIQQYSDDKSSKRLRLCGSFAEGWGSSVSRLGGRVDEDSDIDVSEFVENRLYHLAGKCQCGIAPKTGEIDHNIDYLTDNDESRKNATLEYDRGHVRFTGYASHPARTQYGSLGRPAMDMALVYHCCAYPDIQFFDSPGFLSPLLISQLRAETERQNSCPLVGASLPGMAGKQLRIGTKWLELLLVRSFTDVQGQLYTILKYLFKRVINMNGGQLKSFHAKTLAFRMLRETPTEDWQPERLPELIDVALGKLIDDLRCMDSGVAMQSFFFTDSPLYLKGSKDIVKSTDSYNQSTLDAVLKVKANLDEVLTEFMENLQPLRPNKSIDYHPFMLLPRSKQLKQILNAKEAQKNLTRFASTRQLEYYELHEYVRHYLRELSVGSGDDSRNDLSTLLSGIGRLPDFARTTRECLTALAYMRYDQPVAAWQKLTQLFRSDNKPLRGVPPYRNGFSESNEPSIQHFLLKNDSAWRFCFVQQAPHARPFRFDFLPIGVIQFPRRLLRYDDFYAANFDALAKSLYLHLLDKYGELNQGEESRIRGWFTDMLDSEMDASEMDLVIDQCKEQTQREDLLVRLVLEHKETLIQSRTVHCKLAGVIKNSDEIQRQLKGIFLDGINLPLVK